MRTLAKRLLEFVHNEDGPTAVEYAVMLALIIMVVFTAVQIIGKNSNSAFGTVGSSIGATVSAS
jgi:pilus assembly protein Flp/PilA